MIASDNRGHRELIKDNENGILVNLKDNNGFIDNINLLIDSKDIATKFSINNLKRIEIFKVGSVKDELLKYIQMKVERIFRGCQYIILYLDGQYFGDVLLI